MADINLVKKEVSASRPDDAVAPGHEEPPLQWEIIELLFFAYRDFVGEADHVLEAFGFGRAHHRVVYFVHRNPGLTVADLLAVLRITKQSLGRVLKQLLDEGYIVQRAGDLDRRQRLLFATEKGAALIAELVRLQTRRILRATQDLDPAEKLAVITFLRGMIDREETDKVLERLLGYDKTANKDQ